MADQRLQVVIDAQDRASQHIKGLRGTIQRFRSELRTAGIAATAAGGAIVALGGVAINAASNLEESINAVRVTFGSAADDVLRFGESASQTAGLAAADFNQLATTTGAMLQNFGMTASEAGQATIALTQRAADMASVFNTDVDDALAAIQSGLQGMALPLRRYAVDVTETSLQMEALALGIDKSVTEMTQQEKAQLRLSAIMRQSQKTAGDFVNTSDSFANSMRILRADLTNVAATIGTTLIPIIQPMIAQVMNVAQVVAAWMQANPQLTATIVAVTAAVGGAMLVLGPLLIMLPGLVTAFALLGGAIGALISPLGLAIGAVVAFAIAWRSNFLGIRDIVESVVRAIGNALNALLSGLENTVNAVIRAINRLSGILNLPQLREVTLPRIEDFVSKASEALAKVGEAGGTIVNVFKDLLPSALAQSEAQLDSLAPAVDTAALSFDNLASNIDDATTAMTEYRNVGSAGLAGRTDPIFIASQLAAMFGRPGTTGGLAGGIRGALGLGAGQVVPLGLVQEQLSAFRSANFLGANASIGGGMFDMFLTFLQQNVPTVQVQIDGQTIAQVIGTMAEDVEQVRSS